MNKIYTCSNRFEAARLLEEVKKRTTPPYSIFYCRLKNRISLIRDDIRGRKGTIILHELDSLSESLQTGLHIVMKESPDIQFVITTTDYESIHPSILSSSTIQWIKLKLKPTPIPKLSIPITHPEKMRYDAISFDTLDLSFLSPEERFTLSIYETYLIDEYFLFHEIIRYNRIRRKGHHHGS